MRLWNNDMLLFDNRESFLTYLETSMLSEFTFNKAYTSLIPLY